jgi:hypothetical protein
VRQEIPTRQAPSVFWLGLAALGAASVLGQLWLRSHPWLGWGPMGSDAEFWLARAGGLSASPLVGTHPPGYPLLVWLLGLSWGVPHAGSIVSGVMGALLPVVGGLVGWQAAGWRRGLLAGACTFLLPCLQFSALRAEATTTYGVGLGLVILVAVALDHRRTPWAAAALGLALAALTLTKEQALVLLPGMVLLPVVWAPRRPLLAVLVGLGWLGGVAPFVLAAVVGDEPSILGKIYLPLADMLAWFTDRQIPGPLYQHHAHEPALDSGLESGGPLRIFVALAVRSAGFAGVWTVLAPLSVGLLVADRRRARVDPGARRVLLLAATGAVALLLVPVLGRHVELVLLPLVWGLPLAVRLPAGWPGRAGLAVALVGLGVGAAARVATAELTMLRSSAELVSGRMAQASSIVETLGPQTRLCSRQGWLAAFGDRPLDCSPALPPGGEGVVHLEKHVVQRCAQELLDEAEEAFASDVLIRTDSSDRWSRLVELDCGAAARERERSQRLGGQTGR